MPQPKYCRSLVGTYWGLGNEHPPVLVTSLWLLLGLLKWNKPASGALLPARTWKLDKVGQCTGLRQWDITEERHLPLFVHLLDHSMKRFQVMAGSQVTKKAKGTMGKALWGHTMERWERCWQWTSYYKEIKGAGSAPGTEFWSDFQCGKVSPVCLSIGCRWCMWAFSGLIVRATGRVLKQSEHLVLLEDFCHGLRPFSFMGSSPSSADIPAPAIG